MQTRQTSRKTISLPGRYFTGRGVPTGVTLKDLSVGGCRFAMAPSARLALGVPIQIYIAGTGPHHARAKWVEDGEAGITFSQPLADEQFEKFQNGDFADLPDDTKADTFESMASGRPHRFC